MRNPRPDHSLALKRHVKFSFLSLVLLTLALTGISAPLPRLTELEIRELIQSAVEKENRAPGIVVGLIDEKGSQIIAYGKLNSGRDERVDGDTIFQIGSITKVFTTLLLQDMVDHGEVKLDDPIGKFLPASVKTPSRNGEEITLYHLATHTSGLPKLPFSMWYGFWHIKDLSSFKLKDYYKFLSKHQLERDPGSKFEYSNAGVDLLGHVLELQAGSSYEKLIRERICQPLGMNSTYVVLPPELTNKLASGHITASKWEPTPLDPKRPVTGWNPSEMPGSGDIRSSANDLLKFLSANIGLSASSLSNAMRETHVPREKISSANQIGLGWIIENRSKVIWHNGGMLGYRSYMAFHPEERRGVIVLANCSDSIDDLGEIIMGLRKWHKVAAIKPEILKRYNGAYEFDSKKDLLIRRNRTGDRLNLYLVGQDRFEMFPESETQFFSRQGDVQMTFVINQKSKATELIWSQNGKQRKMMKK